MNDIGVGDKVICVDDSLTNLGPPHDLVKGRIYIVDAIGLTNLRDPEKLPCIKVCGMHGGPYWQHRFRPIKKRKTSIEIFHRILRSASHKELT